MRYMLVCAMMVCLASSSVRGETFADSELDWSLDGVQGENNWFNGYYNLTLDQVAGDGQYSASDFVPFLNDGSEIIWDDSPSWEDSENHWSGTKWDLVDNGITQMGPWTEVTPTGGHPNGVNSLPNEEHWAIRRWVSDRAGDFALLPTLSAANLSGPGTSVELYLNGTRLDVIQAQLVDGAYVATSQAIPRLTTNLGQPVTGIVGAKIAVGDIIDVALTPEGLGGDRNDGSDGSNFWLRVTDDMVPDPLPPPPVPLTSSTLGWSTTGTQGENNWFNGYYNLTLDEVEGDGVYQMEDFIPFDNLEGPAGGPVAPDGNHWTGTQWDLQASGAPWTYVGALGTHPNGTNSAPGDEHWSIRRWVANDLTGTTPLELNWKMNKGNTAGNGVSGKLFVNGEEVDSVTIPGNSLEGVNRKVYINANPGDVIDLALTPEGIGARSDGSDGSQNELIIGDELPAGPLFNLGAKVADSLTEFSGQQGQDNWFYGFYNQRRDIEDGDGQYSADDFVPFLNDESEIIWDDSPSWEDSENHWSGTKWDLVDNGITQMGPWTEVTQGGGHPTANGQGDPEVHWAIRRWVSDVEGDFQISGLLLNGGAGDGVVGRIMLDGQEVWAEVSDGNQETVDLPISLAKGSILDFAIDPDGGRNYNPADPTTIDNVLDGSDGSVFTISIAERILFNPVGLKLGDFNGNGLLDADDIDLLAVAIRDLSTDSKFDLNKDGLINLEDHTFWVKDESVAKTWVGDANLDGEFSSKDFVDAFLAGEYETGGAIGWAGGDWNGDGFFSSQDFVAAFLDGGYELGPQPAISSVPEPSGLVLLGLASLGLLTRRRRRT